MPRCTCSAVISDPDPTREDYLLKRHLISGVHEVGRHYREEMRARCVDQAIRIAAYGATDVFGTAKALEAYIFGDQP
jgi:hypothetical protein